MEAWCLQEDNFFLFTLNPLTVLLTCQLCIKSVESFSWCQKEICPMKTHLIEENYYCVHLILLVLCGSFSIHVHLIWRL